MSRLSKPKKLSPEYVAGFVDGEGCITIHLNRTRASRFWNQAPRVVMQIIISNNYLSVLKQIQKQYGGKIKQHNRKYNKNAADSWVLRYTEQEGAGFLRKILSYLFVKREQALLYLELAKLKERRNRKGRSIRLSEKEIRHRLSIAKKCGKLNKRGR